eukprot:TRINITY_DN10316_c0_g1_i1.p1 TRINITY_DN10316_c0_g1~~TRINITY_DN10316_c0_g1_i1.p1  ORF type:complete len:185 (+),score=55.87 TRINITY_DN10316_c0_g1_i1:63-617(+)
MLRGLPVVVRKLVRSAGWSAQRRWFLKVGGADPFYRATTELDTESVFEALSERGGDEAAPSDQRDALLALYSIATVDPDRRSELRADARVWKCAATALRRASEAKDTDLAEAAALVINEAPPEQRLGDSDLAGLSESLAAASVCFAEGGAGDCEAAQPLRRVECEPTTLSGTLLRAQENVTSAQ